MISCKMSVRTLVEFVYQSGDLIASFNNIERANLGSRIHRQLQAQGGEHYQSEVFLSNTTTLDNVCFTIEGRADGIIIQDHQVILEEIKTTAIPYEQLEGGQLVHLAQAYCYGYFYLCNHACTQLTIRLTYYQINEQKTKSFNQVKTFQELKDFYLDTLKQYLRWANISHTIHTTSTSDLQRLVFPFPEYRKGQRKLAIAVYKTILDHDILFAQAPTGIGKTISTLFPGLKAIGEGKIEKIFYVCAKNITAQVAYDALQQLYKQNLHFKSVAITAKDKICLLAERNCDPQNCPYAKGYYNRNKNALYELITQHDFIDYERLVEYGKKYVVCPFELGLDASEYSDVIIGDYNYVFDPRVYLKRFFIDKGNYLFLVDEAHNLVDRAREMYSAELSKQDFQIIKAYIPKSFAKLHKAHHHLNKQFISLRKQCEEKQLDFLAQKEAMPFFLQCLEKLTNELNEYLEGIHENEMEDALRELYFKALHYQRIAEFYDEHFTTCIQRQKQDVWIRQYCMNPSQPIKNILRKGRATIFFSATLSPIDYYLTLLGGNHDSKRLSLPSPFPKEHVHVMIANQISTRYRQRSQSIDAICELLYAAITQRNGNYILFAPSYAYMKQLYEHFIKSYPDIDVFYQQQDMTEEEKQTFFAQFQISKHLRLYFCVCGGMFSEGIDLKGDALIGVILVGVGLPQINPYSDLIRQHFDEENQQGYAYAYQYPGMNKILQSAGRLIRSHEDKGILLFIDERYTSLHYRGALPSHLHPYTIVHTPQEVRSSTQAFWKKALSD